MKIIITGASGYIGSQVARRLVELEHEIYAIIRPNSKLDLLYDIKNNINFVYSHQSIEEMIDQFKTIKADVVIHIASLFIAEHSAADVDELIESNIEFPIQLLEAMTQSNTKKIISTSTSWEHYNATYNPVCLYAATKKAFEDILRYYVEVKDIDAQILTIYDTYGIGDSRKKIINLLNKVAITGEAIDMSPGEQYLDLIYIDDIVDAYIEALNIFKRNEASGITKYHLRSGKEMKLKDIAKLYSEINNVKLNINWGKRPYRTREVMKPYQGGEILPGWIPKITLEEGLKKLRDNRNK